MSSYATIDQYFVSDCLLIVEDLNQRFIHATKEEIKEFSDKEFQELDLVYLLALPFKNLARLKSIGADIYVKSLDLAAQVKFIKNNKSGDNKNRKNKRCISKAKTDRYTASSTWKDVFAKDIKWLCNEINIGNKGKRAFIFGWFNVVDSFGQIMQLGMCTESGKSSGFNPDVNEDRLKLLPFLNLDEGKTKTKDLRYMYSEAYNKKSITIKGMFNKSVDCIFLGKETDVFHFAIYF